MNPTDFSSAADHQAATQSVEGAAFPLSMPLFYYEGSNAEAKDVAPWVASIDNAVGKKFAVLYQQDMTAGLTPGLYAYVGGAAAPWALAIPYSYLDAYILDGGAVTLYINITKQEAAPVGAELFHSGVPTTGSNIPAGNGVWAALVLNQVFVLQPATQTQLGGVKVGANLGVTSDGVLSVPIATSSTAGVMKPGAGLAVSNGVLAADVVSVAGRTGDVKLAVADVENAAPSSSPQFAGYPSIRTWSDTYKFQIAQEMNTYQHLGPTTLDHSAVYLQLGGSEAGNNDYRMIGFGYVYNSNKTDVPPAMMGFQTTSSVGDWDNTYGDLVFATRATAGKLDQPTVRFRITHDGRLWMTNDQTKIEPTAQELITKAYLDFHSYKLAPATASVLGGVKVGQNLEAKPDGTLSVALASSSVAGVVKVGTGLAVAGDGTLSANVGSIIGTIPKASTTQYGVVEVGAGLTATDGKISAAVTSVAGHIGDVKLSVTDVTGAAPLASPELTGKPTAPTAAATDSSTQVATTAWGQAMYEQNINEIAKVYWEYSYGKTLTPEQARCRVLLLQAEAKFSYTEYLAFPSQGRWTVICDFPESYDYADLKVAGQPAPAIRIHRGQMMEVFADGTNLRLVEAYVLPEATATQLGGVMVGSGLSVANGVLSATSLDVVGTAKQVIATPSGNKVTLSTPQNIDTSADVVFNSVKTNSSISAKGQMSATGTTNFIGVGDVNSGVVRIDGNGQTGWTTLTVSETTKDPAILLQNNNTKKFIGIADKDLVILNGAHNEAARVLDTGSITVAQNQLANGYTVKPQELVTAAYVNTRVGNKIYPINLDYGDTNRWQDYISFWRMVYVPFDLYIPKNLEGSQFMFISANGGDYPFLMYNVPGPGDAGTGDTNSNYYPPVPPIVKGNLNAMGMASATTTPHLTGGDVTVKKGTVLVFGNGPGARQYSTYSFQIITEMV